MVYILVDKEKLQDVIRCATLKARQRCEKNLYRNLIKENEKLVAKNLYLSQIIDEKCESITSKKIIIESSEKKIEKQAKKISKLENEIDELKFLFCDTLLQKQNSDKDKIKEVDEFVENNQLKKEIKSLKERAIYDLNEHNSIWKEFVEPKIDKANKILGETHNVISRIKDRLKDDSKTIDYTFILSELQKLVSFGDKISLDKPN